MTDEPTHRGSRHGRQRARSTHGGGPGPGTNLPNLWAADRPRPAAQANGGA